MSRFIPVLAAAAVLALAGCGGGDTGEPAALPPGSNAPTPAAPTTAAATTPAATAAPTAGTPKSPIRWLGAAPAGPQAAVGAATRAYWSMVVRLAEAPDPADPALTALVAEPQRSTLVTLFTTIRDQGLSQRGPVDGTVAVATLTGATAVVRTCLDQTLTRVYDRAGRARAGSAGTLTRFTVSLTRRGAAWQVTGVAGKDNACRIA
jgi:hypothetical protein